MPTDHRYRVALLRRWRVGRRRDDRGADDLGALRPLVEAEPRSSGTLGAALGVERAWHRRLTPVGPAGRSVLVVVRHEVGVWVAHPHLGAAADAPAVAALIDRSPAVAIEGPSVDVEPVRPLVRRAGSHQTLRRVIVDGDVDWPAPEARTRVATTLDLPDLVQLYRRYELVFGRTERGLRHRLADAIRRSGAVVCDADGGGLAGAIIVLGMAARYIEWGQMSVDPAQRGQGVSWALIARAAAVTKAAGRGFTAVMADSNPMTVPAEVARVERYAVVELALPDRLPGERRARRAWGRLDRARERRPLDEVGAASLRDHADS